MTGHPGTSRIVGTVLAVAFAAAAVVCVVLGVETVPSTGELLVVPVPLTRLSGGWLITGAALATLAGLVALGSWPRRGRPRAG